VHAAGGSFQGGPHIWITQQGLVSDFAARKSVVSIWNASTPFQFSEGVAERERRMGRGFHFNGRDGLKNIAAIELQGSEAFAKPTGAGKNIDDGYRSQQNNPPES
jgi:hypothetical protein